MKMVKEMKRKMIRSNKLMKRISMIKKRLKIRNLKIKNRIKTA